LVIDKSIYRWQSRFERFTKSPRISSVQDGLLWTLKDVVDATGAESTASIVHVHESALWAWVYIRQLGWLSGSYQ
jgi:hypothetical protein